MTSSSLLRTLVLAFLAGALALGASKVGVVGDLLQALERKSQDYRMARYRGGRLSGGTAPSDVVIVAVDGASLSELGRFPLWPRAYHARLVDTLAAKGARVVAFDLLFADPDTLPTAVRRVRAGEVAREGDADPLEVDRLLASWGGDEAFADALRRAGNVVLASDPASGARPLDVLAAAAAGVGHVAMPPDPDGMLRRVPLRGAPDDTVPPLALAAVAAALGPRAPEPPVGASVALDLLGPRGTFLTLSYADVLAGRVDDVLLRDRVVFVGAAAAGLGDLFATPYGEDLPGVEAHATLAYQTLRGGGLREAARGARVAAAALPAVGAAALVTLTTPLVSAIGSLLLAAAFVVVAFEAFAQADLVLPFAFPLLSWALAVFLSAAYRYGAEGRQRREIQRAFGRYVAPEVVEEIARQPGALRVGGQARVVTVGFVDIRGFTTLAEALEPEQLATFLHAFFTVVEGKIHQHRGTVDKYIGDAVMMIFGAPNDLADAPEAACRAAQDIVDAVAAHAETWATLGVAQLRVGVGLETGRAVVGNVGSERRFDYTALGDTVNVASRLQDLNKELGTTMLVGPGTREAVGDAFSFRSHGTITLRGRPAPLPVFELVGRDADGAMLSSPEPHHA